MVAVGVGGAFIFFVVIATIMLAISDTEFAKDWGNMLLFGFCVSTGGVGVITAIIYFVLLMWRDKLEARKVADGKGTEEQRRKAHRRGNLRDPTDEEKIYARMRMKGWVGESGNPHDLRQQALDKARSTRKAVSRKPELRREEEFAIAYEENPTDPNPWPPNWWPKTLKPKPLPAPPAPKPPVEKWPSDPSLRDIYSPEHEQRRRLRAEGRNWL